MLFRSRQNMAQPFLSRLYNFAIREPVLVASFALGTAGKSLMFWLLQTNWVSGPLLVLTVPTDTIKARRQKEKEEFIQKSRGMFAFRRRAFADSN